MQISTQVDQARETATRAHHGQHDKIGVPYIEHPAMVAALVQALPSFAAADAEMQEDAVAAAWLHDVVEDTDETAERLRAAGISARAVEAVVALTRTTDVAEDDYYAGIRTSPVALLVKTADVASNLAPERVAQLDDATRTRLAIKYEHALVVLGVERSVITALHESRSGGVLSAPTASTRPEPRIDLHTHSNRSDGTDAPADLVRKAADVGLTVVALTDHDTTAGWAEASAAAAPVGLELVRGLELSVEDGGVGYHLLAYEPDPDDAALVDMLARSIEARDLRIPAMVEKIAVQVPGLRLEDVLAIAGDAVPGRPHLAEALVACGAATDRKAAFAAYLVPGCDTYLETWSPPMADAIRIVGAAGGATVIAHPRGRNSTITAERLAELAVVGLAGIEVDHQEHGPEARQALRRIAEDLGLVVTGSSDYHGTRKQDHDLGCNTTAPDQYERLAALWARPAPVPASARGL